LGAVRRAGFSISIVPSSPCRLKVVPPAGVVVVNLIVKTDLILLSGNPDLLSRSAGLKFVRCYSETYTAGICKKPVFIVFYIYGVDDIVYFYLILLLINIVNCFYRHFASLDIIRPTEVENHCMTEIADDVSLTVKV